MRAHLISMGLVLGAASPAFAQDDAFWVHPYNFFGEPTALTASVNLGDLDGDGDIDGFAVNGRHWIQQNEIYLNNGMGFSGLPITPARTGPPGINRLDRILIQ